MDFPINFDFFKYCIKRLFISTAEFLGPPLVLGPAVSASLASPHPCPWREGTMTMTVLGAPLQAGAKGRGLFRCLLCRHLLCFGGQTGWHWHCDSALITSCKTWGFLLEASRVTTVSSSVPSHQPLASSAPNQAITDHMRTEGCPPPAAVLLFPDATQRPLRAGCPPSLAWRWEERRGT